MADPTSPGTISRRTLLRAGVAATAAGGISAAASALPAWARPIASAAAGHVRKPDSLPYPKHRAGTAMPGLKQIEHVVVVMMENHSYDNLLGMVAGQVRGRRHADGFRLHAGKPLNWNPDPSGGRVYATRASSPCQVEGHPNQDWNASHESWNNGRNDGFVKACTDVAMWYWDRSTLPFTYSLVEHYPFGERYFSSVLAQTYPNRRFLFCGTASGLTATDAQTFSVRAANGTIFDRLDRHGISWRDYAQTEASPEIVPNFNVPQNVERVRPFSDFHSDAAQGRLPHVSFLEPNYSTTSEENPQDIQVGEEFLAGIVHSLTHSPKWDRTALFITWDEHGGYYDHVPPPRAIKPDNIAPLPDPNQTTALVPGGYDRYGFRVPLIVVSPWARKGYISRIVQDHTSITAFIEHKWNLPAMTYRDANAHPMTDYFDFRKPAFAHPPKLAAAPSLTKGLALCKAAGLTPPAGT